MELIDSPPPRIKGNGSTSYLHDLTSDSTHEVKSVAASMQSNEGSAWAIENHTYVRASYVWKVGH